MTISTISPDERTGARAESLITRGVQKTVLPNGLTLITKELHDKPIVAQIIWYRVGSRNEELGQTGKSHFLEHMLFKGTDRYKKGEIDMITLRNGGANNAFTWLDFTAYYFTFASDRWQEALEIEANRMRHTSFAQQEFDSEKQVVEEELRIGLDGPWEALENEVWATAFREHPYHWPTVGWLGDLESATAADMKAYYDKWYHPQNATLVIVGDFNTREVVERVHQLYGPLDRGPEPRPVGIVEPPQRGEKRVTVKKDTPVERLLIGYHAPAVGDADSYALHVADTILSTGKTSRLYQRLVEKDQSVTQVKAHYNDHIDPSLFYIQAELKPGFSLDGVERAIYEEIERLKTEGLPSSQLEKAKRQIEADLVLSNEEFLQQAILLGQYETIAFADHIPEDSRGYKYLDTMLDRLRAVTAEDVARAAEKYFAPDNRTVGFLVNDTTEISDSKFQISNPKSRMSRVAFRTGVEPTNAADQETGAVISTRPRLDVERLVLPNGMVVLLSENHTTSSVSINAIVQAGSRFEPDAKAGLASLVGELIDEGTKTRTSDEIAEAVEAVGGRFITAGDYQASGVRAAFLSSDISLGLEITADVLMNATFPEEKVRQHVERRVAQIKSRLDVPRVQASDEFNEEVFKGYPLHRPPVGYGRTVKTLTRDDCIEFYRRYYVPNNTILAIVGDIDKVEVKNRIEEVFANWEKAADFHAPDVPRPERPSAGVEKFVPAPKEQVNIFIGHVGVERTNPDYYSLLVMDTILGSSPGFTSRIPRILRDEQGLAYSTYSNITASAGIDPGRFVAYIGTSPENLDRAVEGLRREIRRIVNEPVTTQELESAKAYLTGSFVFDFQTNAQTAEFLIETEIYGLGYDYLEKYPELIRAVTVEKITRVTRTYLDPERLTTVVVGPVTKNGELRVEN
ncbi:MAG TPA: pitrilysin family protein [Blastocatellia bacterium]|nr:pitrilysin family protein [Blastocatellia bacterium]